jgi:predicted amidohydrolase
MTWDILIRHSTLIDGSGRQSGIGDVALTAGRIAALGPSLAGEANKVIDAAGLAVTPGFIDIRTAHVRLETARVHHAARGAGADRLLTAQHQVMIGLRQAFARVGGLERVMQATGRRTAG